MDQLLDGIVDEPIGPSPIESQEEVADEIDSAATDAAEQQAVAFEDPAENPLDVLDSSTKALNWHEEPFQTLLFYVMGLPLVAPLLRLNGVIPWSDDIARLPNSPSWDLGILPHRGGKIRVVDTAQLVYSSRHFDAERKPLHHIVLIQGGRWGLACEAIGDVLNLQPDQVKWRTSAGERAWLAGTVKEHLCSLIDVDAFATSVLAGLNSRESNLA